MSWIDSFIHSFSFSFMFVTWLWLCSCILTAANESLMIYPVCFIFVPGHLIPYIFPPSHNPTHTNTCCLWWPHVDRWQVTHHLSTALHCWQEAGKVKVCIPAMYVMYTLDIFPLFPLSMKTALPALLYNCIINCIITDLVENYLQHIAIM